MWNSGRWRIAACTLTILILLGGAAPLWADPPAVAGETPAPAAPEEPAVQPRIEFATLQHDFGKVGSGPNLETTFDFKNAGEGVLVIEKVKGG